MLENLVKSRKINGDKMKTILNSIFKLGNDKQDSSKLNLLI